MLFYIEIAPESLPLITELNNGVTPEIETSEDPNYFVFNSDPDGHNDIITLAQWEKAAKTTDCPHIIPVLMF